MLWFQERVLQYCQRCATCLLQLGGNNEFIALPCRTQAGALAVGYDKHAAGLFPQGLLACAEEAVPFGAGAFAELEGVGAEDYAPSVGIRAGWEVMGTFAGHFGWVGMGADFVFMAFTLMCLMQWKFVLPIGGAFHGKGQGRSEPKQAAARHVGEMAI